MKNESPSILALFPGQGSQSLGMGKELFSEFALARAVFEEVSDHSHLNLKKLCFDGPDTELQKTEITQPAIFAVSMAAFRVAEAELGIRPQAVAGHSLGEYAALVAAGALPLGLTAEWLRQRGLAMQAAVPIGQGGMAAIMGLDFEAVTQLCEKATQLAKNTRDEKGQGRVTDDDGQTVLVEVPAIVTPANDNAPGQIVIAGSVDALDAALSHLKEGKEFPRSKAVKLKVSAPFHCPLMLPARERMRDVFEKSKFSPSHLKCPYIPNRTGRPTSEAGLILRLLEEQIDHPVLWRTSMLQALENGITQIVEFGPGKVLAGLLKRIAPPSTPSLQIKGVNDLATLKDLEAWIKNPTPVEPKP